MAVLLAGCSATVPTARPFGSAGAPDRTASPVPPADRVADVLLRGARVITMDDVLPSAEAVAIAGDRILAVGDDDEVSVLAGPDTTIVDLGGLAVVPGFIDAHQHRIGDGTGRLGVEPRVLIDAAIAQGLTTIDELFVNEVRLDELRALDEAGVLRLRVNAYLPVNENSAEGRPLGDYYTAYRPGQMVSPRVRVAGLKVFTDFDNATILLWDQADLDRLVLARHREGWPLAIKTVSTTSLGMILHALRRAREAEPGIVDARVRLEHMLFATPEQLATIAELGVVPAVNTNVPGELVGDAGIDALIAREPDGSYAPWRSLFEAGIPAAGISGFPSFYVEEPTGAPFGSPIHLIWQAVTRAGNLGVRSPDELLDQALTAEQALRAHTINAAYADFEDDVKGSITAGKLADLVVLSADPLVVPAESINDIRTLMTMIGGVAAFCAAGSEAICPPSRGGQIAGASPTPVPPVGTNLAPGASVEASSELPGAPAGNVVDGSGNLWNAAAVAPQWIELTLAVPGRVDAIRLVVAQDPGGHSVHELWVGRAGGAVELVHVFEGETFDGNVLTFAPAEPIPDVRVVRVVTTSLGDLFPAWREIEIAGSDG